MLALYRFATHLVRPFLPLYLHYRQLKGKEMAPRLQERYGIPTCPRPDGILIWFHAASVGETQSIHGLVSQLSHQYPDINLLITTSTVNAALFIEKNFPDHIQHQFLPLDVIPYVEKFLSFWRPEVAVFVESELWPTILNTLQRRHTRTFLINAGVSQRSLRSWLRFPRLAYHLLQTFTCCYARSQRDAERLQQLGATKVKYLGNLKFTTTPLKIDQSLIEAFAHSIKGRPTWVAASTHPGEDEIILQAHYTIRQSIPEALLLLVPRHIERAAHLENLCKRHNFTYQRRSQGTSVKDSSAILIGDSLGEMGLYYSLAQVAFVGGSLVPIGGHNIIEPTHFHCAIVHGPYMESCREIATLFHDHQASFEARDSASLASIIIKLLASLQQRAIMQAAAEKVLASQQHEMNSIIEHIVFSIEQFKAQRIHAVS